MMANKGWDEFEIGAMLRSFDGKIDECCAFTPQSIPSFDMSVHIIASTPASLWTM